MRVVLELFIKYYNFKFPTENLLDFILETDDAYFEVNDAESGEVQLLLEENKGIAKFSNSNNIAISIAKYETFMTELPQDFQRGKGRCDFLLISQDKQNFILGELKNSLEVKHYRNKARKQLLSSLMQLMEIPEIKDLIHQNRIKRCCYFNKQSKSPVPNLSAPEAFNRLSKIYREGFKMKFDEVESLGFEFFEYTGRQILFLN